MHSLSAFKPAAVSLTRASTRIATIRLCLQRNTARYYSGEVHGAPSGMRSNIGKTNDLIPHATVRVIQAGDAPSSPRLLKDLLQEIDREVQVIELIKETPFPTVQIYDKEDQRRIRAVRNVGTRNEKIPYRFVRVAQATGGLTPTRPLRDLLEETDLNVNVVELIKEYPTPVVKVFDKKELALRMRAVKEAAKNAKAKSVQKEVQLTWEMGAGDIKHKVQKLRDQLEKGHRVNLIFAPKKKRVWTPLPPWRELVKQADNIVEELKDVSSELKGARKSQRKMLFITLQGSAKST